MAEHTPTPWRVGSGPNGEVEIFGRMLMNASPILAYLEHEPREANAAFIVKAVNMHDELVSAIGKIDSIMRRNLTATNKLDKIAGILTDIDPVLAKALEA